MEMKQKPTPGQQVLLEVIRDLLKKHEYGPTSMEIANATKENINTVKWRLRLLKEAGFVRLAHGGKGYLV